MNDHGRPVVVFYALPNEKHFVQNLEQSEEISVPRHLC